MIHGVRNGSGWVGAFHRVNDWTAGCIAVTDKQIEEIYQCSSGWHAYRNSAMKPNQAMQGTKEDSSLTKNQFSHTAPG